jgi:aspartokinase-like uncharacterized kinase
VKKKKKLILFPMGLIEQIEAYQHSQQITSFTAAVLELVRKGLASNSR